MATSVEVGVFGKTATTTNGATQDITTGFTPKAIIVWTGGSLAIEDTNNSYFQSYGFSDGTNNRVGTHTEGDNLATSDNSRYRNTSNCIAIISAGASLTLEASVTFAANKFTATWNTNTSGWTDLQCHYIVFGGSDITGVEAGTLTATTGTGTITITTSAATQNITAGNGVLFVLGGSGDVATTVLSNNKLQIGVTDGVSQGTCAAGGDDGEAALESYQAYSESKLYLEYNETSGALQWDISFAGFNASGFDITKNTAAGTARAIEYLIIKGGQWDMGNETALTAGTTKDTTTAFTPKGMINFATLRTIAGNSRQDISLSIGAADGITETSCGISTNDTSDPTQTGCFSNNTKTIRIMDQADGNAPTVNGEADVTFGTNKFTADWTNLASSAWKFLWVVCGDEAAAAGFVHSYGVIIA